MHKAFSFVLLLLMVPRFDAQRAVDPDSEQGRILSLENAWNQAVQQKDATALKILLGPELVYVDFDGKLMDKTEYLASVQAQSLLHPGRIMNETMKYIFSMPSLSSMGCIVRMAQRMGSPMCSESVLPTRGFEGAEVGCAWPASLRWLPNKEGLPA